MGRRHVSLFAGAGKYNEMFSVWFRSILPDGNQEERIGIQISHFQIYNFLFMQLERGIELWTIENR